MNYLYTFLILILISSSVISQPISPLILDENGTISSDILFENDQISFEICGIDEGRKYFVYAFDYNRNPLCSYEISINSHEGNSFIGNQRCNTVTITQENECVSTSNMLSFQVYPFQERINERASQLTFDQLFAAKYLVINLFAGIININESSIMTSGAISKFENGSTNIGFDDGIILATAPIDELGGANTTTGAGGPISPSLTDVDIEQLIDFGTNDCSMIEFDFIATSPTISFDYIFASEEYCDWVESPYRDAMGVFLSGSDINGSYSNNSINIALLPEETRDSSINSEITIGTINHIKNSDFYIDNNVMMTIDELSCDGLPLNPQSPTETQFDGYTVPLTAQYDSLVIGETYHLKIVVCDGSDKIFGSAVFLKAHSLSSIPNINSFGFYPNPIKDTLFIKGKNSIINIKIFSMTGIVVLEQAIEAGENTISLSNIPSGIYILKVNESDWYKLVVE